MTDSPAVTAEALIECMKKVRAKGFGAMPLEWIAQRLGMPAKAVKPTMLKLRSEGKVFLTRDNRWTI